MAAFTIKQGMKTNQRKTGLIMLFPNREPVFPVYRYMAVAAIQTEFAGMDIHMAINTGCTGMGENKRFMTLPAAGFFVGTYQGEPSIRMLKLDRFTFERPAFRTVAQLAIKIDVAMWIVVSSSADERQRD